MTVGNELAELYDSLSLLYQSLPDSTHPEWEEAIYSVVYGGNLLAARATCYGSQQNSRNDRFARHYRRSQGNGDHITDFSAIRVAKPQPADREHVPSGAQLPISPKSGKVLPVEVTEEEIDNAIALLAEFPAEPPADDPGEGVDTLLDPDRVDQARKATSDGTAEDEVTLLFVSDTHFGYERRVVTGRGKTVPWIDEISSIDTFRNIVEVALSSDVDAVVHTGDFLDHEVDANTLDATAFRLELLSAHGVPVYCIIGSHDHDSHYPQHPQSTDGIAWLRDQVVSGRLTELTVDPSPVPSSHVDIYGISAGDIGLADVGKNHSRQWDSSDVDFGLGSSGPNVLCLHESSTPYRPVSTAEIDLNRLLSMSSVSFDCVLIGDEHRPLNGNFEAGYEFETDDGTPVYYTGPAAQVSSQYSNKTPFVTELTITSNEIKISRHSL